MNNQLFFFLLKSFGASAERTEKFKQYLFDNCIHHFDREVFLSRFNLAVTFLQSCTTIHIPTFDSEIITCVKWLYKKSLQMRVLGNIETENAITISTFRWLYCGALKVLKIIKCNIDTKYSILRHIVLCARFKWLNENMGSLQQLDE